jgi:hypothetical protein
MLSAAALKVNEYILEPGKGALDGCATLWTRKMTRHAAHRAIAFTSEWW